MCLMVNCAWTLKWNIPTAREGTLYRRHFWMKKKRSAVVRAEGRCAFCEENPGWNTTTTNQERRRNQDLRYRFGTRRSCGCVFFFSPLWLTIFYIIMTQLGLGIDSLVKVLCGKKMCMKWKTTNLRRGFSSSRRFAATAQTLYGR